jgi:hypothetical protein
MPRPSLGAQAMTDAERQRRHRERLRREHPIAPDPHQLLHAARREIERLHQRVRELERRPAAKPKAADESAETARLKTANRNLRAKLNRMAKFYENEQDQKGIMPLATYGAVMRCLHPDQSPPTAAQRDEACKLFSRWRQGNAKRPARHRNES